MLVAPYMGAWIEISSPKSLTKSIKLSHPTWVRGLKYTDYKFVEWKILSHPTWVRGLKSNGSRDYNALAVVAPYMGAWIGNS